MQTATIAEKPRKQAISGRFWAGRTYRGRIKDDHKIDCAVDGGGFLMRAVELLGLRRWLLLPAGYYKEEGQQLICSR